MTTPWKNRLRIGVPEIDEEHEQLFATLDRFESTMRRGNGRTQVEAVLGFLRSYALTHFANEEAMMERSGYPQVGAHRQAHAAFLEKLDRLQAELRETGVTWVHSVELHASIYDWLLGHIAVADREFGLWLREHAEVMPLECCTPSSSGCSPRSTRR